MQNEPTTSAGSERTESAEDFVAKIQEASNAFTDLCIARHEMGAEQYGQFTWLENDTLNMCIEELADACNYLHYQAVKLMVMKYSIEDVPDPAANVGPGAFQRVQDYIWQKKGWQNPNG